PSQSAGTAAAEAPAPAPTAAEAPPPAPSGKPAEAPMPAMPPWKHGENIFAGPKLGWVDPYGPAHLKSMLALNKAKDPQLAGIDEADGLALNVSNYKATSTEIAYGKEISKLLGGKHFVIDTSRNGNGPPKCNESADDEKCWCNPPGRALGSPPTATTADP